MYHRLRYALSQIGSGQAGPLTCRMRNSTLRVYGAGNSGVCTSTSSSTAAAGISLSRSSSA